MSLLLQLGLLLFQFFMETWESLRNCYPLELILELLDLVGVLLQESVFWVLVYYGFVLDQLCPGSVSQSTECLLVIVVSWGTVGKHYSFSVSSKRVLQKSSQFRISVRNMLGSSLNQGANDVSQSTEGQIDLLAFFHTRSCGTCLAQSLASCQINQI